MGLTMQSKKVNMYINANKIGNICLNIDQLVI